MKRILVTLIALTIFAISSQGVFAASSLEVIFDPNPLFDEHAFSPGDSVEQSFRLTNNSNETKNVFLQFVRQGETKDLSQAISIRLLDENKSLLHNNTLSGWFRSGAVSIGSIAPGQLKAFYVDSEFNSSASNEYQGGSVNFDVCVTLSGTGSVCTEDVSGGDSGGQEGGRGGSPQSFRGQRSLSIASDLANESGVGSGDESTGAEEGDVLGTSSVNVSLRNFLREINQAGDEEEKEESLVAALDKPDRRKGSVLGAQASTAFSHLSEGEEGVFKCVSIFMLILLGVGLLTFIFDRLRDARSLAERPRKLTRTSFVASLLLASTIISYLIPVSCAVIPLYVSTWIAVLAYIFVSRKLSL